MLVPPSRKVGGRYSLLHAVCRGLGEGENESEEIRTESVAKNFSFHSHFPSSYTYIHIRDYL